MLKKQEQNKSIGWSKYFHHSVLSSIFETLSYHFDRNAGQVPVCDGRVVALHDINALSGQSLDDRQVGLKRRGLLGLQDKSAHTAVKLAGQKQTDDGGFDVLLVVLVCVERVPQILWNMVCNGKNLGLGDIGGS